MKLSLRFVCVALVIAALGFVFSTNVIPSHAATSPATIVTDLKKYSEGQTMLISGTGFTAGAAVYISVLRPDNLTDYQTAVADGAGAFQASYTPSAPAVLGRYKITATDGTNTANIASTEADASYNLVQCAQNDSKQGQPLGLGYCNWIGSSLGSQNSLLYEGIATEQQLLITGITGTTHTLVVGIEATKGGKHTYDWLVSDAVASGTVGDSSKNSQQASALAGITVVLNRCGDSLGTTDKAACNALLSGATSSNTVDIEVPDDPFVSKDGLTQTKIHNYEEGVPSATCKFCGFGNRTVRLYTNGTISGTPTMTLEHRAGKLSGSFGDGATLANGADTADSYIWYKITWTGGGTSAMLAAGADVAYGSDGTGRSWGANVGATDVGGDPYHFYLIGFDGDGGSLDNQMSSNAVFTLPTRLTLHKAVVNDNGGTAAATDWTLSASGPTNISGTDGAAAVTSANVNPGTYNLSESAGPTGYTASQYSCVLDGGNPVSGNSITLGEGDTAVCTITNNDNPPQLHLRKTVTNDNGGTALNTAWTLTATGTLANPTNLTGTTPVDSSTTTFKADTYALAEINGPSGYTAGAWSCGTATMPDATHVTVPLGGDVTCTINNNDNPPQLHLRKTITNDNGGTASITDWTLTATGTLASPTNLSGTTPVDSSTTTFKADTYALAEINGPSGYTAGAWSCGTATMPDATHVTVPLGGNVTCTINNNDTQPGLHLRKTVTNDNGGTALNTAWTLTATGTLASPTNLSGTTPVDSAAGFKADTYALAEINGPSGYTAGAWSCGTATMPDATHVTVPLGGDVTCTINNNDNPPQLHLRKTITNDNGGTASITDWTLTATGTLASPTNLSGTTPVDSSTTTFKADTYALAEINGPSGYTAGAWSCGTATMPNATHVTVPLGGNVTCTINNNDNPPALHLRKLVVNGASGTALATDWTLTAGPNGISGSTPVDSGATFQAGTYALSESGPAGYSPSGWTCVGGTMPDATHVTIGIGGSATCTITNTALSKLTVLKTIQGNSATFNFDTTSPNNFLPASISATPPNNGTAASSQANALVIPAGDYAISENLTGMNGWLLTDKSCTGVVAGATATGVTFTATYGQNITCTFINDQQSGTVTRTQGFWATHTVLANDIWNGTPLPPNTSTLTPGKVAGNGDDFFAYVAGGACPVGGFTITASTTPEENIMMGGFWASVSQTTSKGGKRSAIDQARMQAIQQYLAAVLNAYAFGTQFTSIYGGFLQFRTDYCGTNANNISRWIGVLGTFNSKGDSALFTPGASATSQDSKNQADIDGWDHPTNPIDD